LVFTFMHPFMLMQDSFLKSIIKNLLCSKLICRKKIKKKKRDFVFCIYWFI
jgi:hypothetical protein